MAEASVISGMTVEDVVADYHGHGIQLETPPRPLAK
jgi:hypothetical protein